MANPDIEGLLEGLEGAARDERAELIGWLLEQGFTLDQIRTANAPALLPTGRVVGQDDDYVSTREIAEAHGTDLELLQRVQRALGLTRVDDPDAAVHLRADGEATAHMQRFLDAGLKPDDIVQVVRVLAEGLSHAAEVMRYASLAAVLEPGGTELEIAKRSQELVSRIAPLLGPWIKDMLFMHLRHQLEIEAVTASELSAGSALPGARHVVVAFADLVGFTRLGEVVPPRELEQLANRLAEQARDVAVPPVRFVKTIGDAVMFVCTDAAALLDAVLKLVEATDSDADFPRLRAGVASGPAVSRAGDWFGNPVNMASRVTGVARPGSVLVAESVHEDLADTGGFSWSFAGPRHLKGIKDDVRLFRVRRGEAG
ncbi:MAG TPA: adenylate/guanylate cyclase domain-containing protein [Mycobacterium sp.]|nr:adenylate/guanylate cyclase domain-containing protein [Mycobacterium sp.]